MVSLRKTGPCMTAVLVVLMFGLSTEKARATWPALPIGASLDPVSKTKTAGSQELKLSILTGFDCEDLKLTIATEKLRYDGGVPQTISVRADEMVELTLVVDVPPQDTSLIQVDIAGCGYTGHAILSFVTTGDSVEYWHGRPVAYRPGIGVTELRPCDQPRPTELDSNLYEYILDLRVKASLKFVKSLPIELTPTEQEHFYSVWLTREQFRKLKVERVKGRMVEGQLEDSLPPTDDRIPPDSSTDTIH